MRTSPEGPPDAAPALRVLAVTSEWPTPDAPGLVPWLWRRTEALRARDVHVDVLPFRGAGRPRNYLRARRQVGGALRASDYDLVHAHFGQAGLAVLPCRLPVVVSFYGSDLAGIVGEKTGRYTLGSALLVRLSGVVARRCDAVIVASERIATRLPPGVPYRVIPAGVDLGVFTPGPRDDARRRLGLPLGRALVLFSGHPDIAVKRFGLAKQAVEVLGPNHELVTMVGVDSSSVVDYMRACDALLVTAIHEGGPTTVKEALACGLPVVSTDVGDVAGWITDVEGCVLLADDDPRTIAAGLRTVLAQGTLGTKARIVAEGFDEEMLTTRQIDVYRAVARRSGLRE